MAHKKPLPASIQTLIGLYDNGLIDLNPSYQRDSNVWDKARKEKFVYTMLNNTLYVIPTIYLNQKFNSDDLPSYEVVDGKQRLTTIIEYVKGYQLDRQGKLTQIESKLKSPKIGDVKHQNKTFKQLEDKKKTIIQLADVPVIALQQYTVKQMQEIFLVLQEGVALNQGEKLSAMDEPLNRAAEMTELVFLDILKRIKPNAKRGYWNTTILHLLAIEVEPDIITSFKPLRSLVSEFSDQTKIDLATDVVMDFLCYMECVVNFIDSIDNKKAIAQSFNEVQLVGLFMAWKMGAMTTISPEVFAGRWDEFILTKAKVKAEKKIDLIFSPYNGLSQEGSNQPENRKTRGDLILQYLS